MNFVKLLYDGQHYIYKGGSNLEMDILGNFLSSDVVHNAASSYRDWLLRDPNASACGNITGLYKENGLVYLSDLLSDEAIPTELKLSVKQFLQLLDDWEKKVCKPKPKKVIIKHENDQFIIETSDQL